MSHLELLLGESRLLGEILGLVVQDSHLVPFSQNLQKILVNNKIFLLCYLCIKIYILWSSG